MPRRKGRTKAYRDYVNSPAWRARRLVALRRAGHRCQFEIEGPYGDAKRCPRTRYLTVHHLTYARLGKERDEDLEVLCWLHHHVEHAMWARCARCKHPALGSYKAAEAFVRREVRAVAPGLLADLDRPRGRSLWGRLPSKFLIDKHLPRHCVRCAPFPED